MCMSQRGRESSIVSSHDHECYYFDHHKNFNMCQGCFVRGLHWTRIIRFLNASHPDRHFLFQCVLSRVNQWPFNAFILDNVTGGGCLPLPIPSVEVFQLMSFLSSRSFTASIVCSFVSLVRSPRSLQAGRC